MKFHEIQNGSRICILSTGNMQETETQRNPTNSREIRNLKYSFRVLIICGSKMV